MKDVDDVIILAVHLRELPDSELITIRNRVAWECKRRIAEGNTKLKHR